MLVYLSCWFICRECWTTSRSIRAADRRRQGPVHTHQSNRDCAVLFEVESSGRSRVSKIWCCVLNSRVRFTCIDSTCRRRPPPLPHDQTAPYTHPSLQQNISPLQQKYDTTTAPPLSPTRAPLMIVFPWTEIGPRARRIECRQQGYRGNIQSRARARSHGKPHTMMPTSLIPDPLSIHDRQHSELVRGVYPLAA